MMTGTEPRCSTTKLLEAFKAFSDPSLPTGCMRLTTLQSLVVSCARTGQILTEGCAVQAH